MAREDVPNISTRQTIADLGTELFANRLTSGKPGYSVGSQDLVPLSASITGTHQEGVFWMFFTRSNIDDSRVGVGVSASCCFEGKFISEHHDRPDMLIEVMVYL
jgi:hypothetical protein